MSVSVCKWHFVMPLKYLNLKRRNVNNDSNNNNF